MTKIDRAIAEGISYNFYLKPNCTAKQIAAMMQAKDLLKSAGLIVRPNANMQLEFFTREENPRHVATASSL